MITWVRMAQVFSSLTEQLRQQKREVLAALLAMLQIIILFKLSLQPGISGGYLGVGLDEFGAFSLAQGTGGRVGGTPAAKPDSVAVRGRESTSYNFLTTASVPGGIDNKTNNINTTIRSDAKRSVQITLFPTTSATPNRLTVAFDLDNNGSFGPGETLIDIPNLATTNGAVPSTFKFGFAASTGPSTNIHELNNLLVETVDTPTLTADVSIVKQGATVAALGSTITYTIAATNIGTISDAKDVLIQDILPPGLTSSAAPTTPHTTPQRGLSPAGDSDSDC